MPDRKTVPRMQGLTAKVDAHGQGTVGAAQAKEGQTLSGRSLVITYANLVRLPHTLFALPFALVGTIYASYTAPITLRHVLLVLLAFTAARFAAMAFNRIVDSAFDALNPRTREREIPAGRISPRNAGVAVAVAAFVFVGAAAALNPLCLFLSIPALFWILAYSYTKRFTHWSHLWLGASLAIAPVGGYIAITGAWSTPTWTLLALAAAVQLWVAGFDMFYALQDRDFDKEHRLKSAVVLLGIPGSIRAARLMHYGAIGLFFLFTRATGMGQISLATVGIAGLALLWEHRLVKPGDLSRLDAAFFTMNGIVSVVVFLGLLVDRVV